MADKCKGSMQIRFEILVPLLRGQKSVAYKYSAQTPQIPQGKGFIDENSEGQVLLTTEGRKISHN